MILYLLLLILKIYWDAAWNLLLEISVSCNILSDQSIANIHPQKDISAKTNMSGFMWNVELLETQTKYRLEVQATGNSFQQNLFGDLTLWKQKFY